MTYREIQTVIEQAAIDAITDAVAAAVPAWAGGTVHYRGFHTDDEPGEDEETRNFPAVGIKCMAPVAESDRGIVDLLFEMPMTVTVETHFRSDPKRTHLGYLAAIARQTIEDGEAVDDKAPLWIRFLGTRPEPTRAEIIDREGMDELRFTVAIAATTEDPTTTTTAP